MRRILIGKFTCKIDCVDIATSWSEQRAVWHTEETEVLEQIKQIEKGLPFPLLDLDCNNRAEFLNHHLLIHFTQRKHPVQFTRTRAYQKDDNAHLKQKNWTHIRQWLGYQRLDDPRVINLLNDLYEQEWRLFHNFYRLSMELVSKKGSALKPSNAMIILKLLTRQL